MDGLGAQALGEGKGLYHAEQPILTMAVESQLLQRVSLSSRAALKPKLWTLAACLWGHILGVIGGRELNFLSHCSESGAAVPRLK